MWMWFQSGDPLFQLVDKYDSGTGWPSLHPPARTGQYPEPTTITKTLHDPHGSALENCRDPPGACFDDGLAPTGMRYCMNSAALRSSRLKSWKRGPWKYLALFQWEGKKGKGLRTRVSDWPELFEDQTFSKRIPFCFA